ncbi:MAG: hypothetical protein A2845_06065 [Candidatus Lloydbacteria bacterium RIFCSPHIGHO2_01_FULL_49_22]|uniref:Uncharacterized protein n=1 Tax=Candidatus Lloydbacteria bacterium RIFCSPHIGHO2_01_FULL_49_22 TaxID=1798658 RepID=A0A1G2CYJ7_9BACT|nr:MAG: hypothetical protein A2845_06065 [Candidatus Lloydbacteria bacterium RIFCSPHIGHO2_01_FULL_49_22]OGZ08809.1 MAG: hypothetical protein A3C14_01075 [Candidatus Lloydbacteria bacterium RIFCSPHIGHO2_02_FULL_50_18]
MHKSLLTLLLLSSAPILSLGSTVPAWELVGQKTGVSRPLWTKEITFENPQSTCAKNDTCDLKKIIFRTEDYVLPADPLVDGDPVIQSTHLFAGLVTSDVAALTRYSFVQFTRGCMWQSYMNDKNEVETEFGVLRDFLGITRIQHVFPSWVVDTSDTDPAYATVSEFGDRHYLLQHAKAIPSWIPDRQGKLFGENRPVIPFGYVTDTPGPAYYSPNMKMAVNMSLEFRMCVFKTIDVPLVTNGTDLDSKKALMCFDWESKFVFDHFAIEFKKQKNINAECARPFNAREENYHQYRLEQGGRVVPSK